VHGGAAPRGIALALALAFNAKARQELRILALHEVDQPFANHAAQVPRQPR